MYRALHRRRRRRGAEARSSSCARRSANSRAARVALPRARRRGRRGSTCAIRSIAASLESLATLARAMPTGVFDQRAHRRLPVAPVRRARPHQRLSRSCRRKLLPRRHQSRHRRIGHLRRARARRTCRSRARSRRRARCRACFRRSRSTARTTSTARSTRRCMRRVALDDGVRLLLLRQSAGAVRRAARPHARTPRRRDAEPRRAAARARADVPRDHPFAHAGRHGEVPRAVSRTRASCCSSRTARTPTCSSRTSSATAQRKRLCALAFATTRQSLRGARGRRSRRCSRGTASRCATTASRDATRTIADALTDPRPLRAAPRRRSVRHDGARARPHARPARAPPSRRCADAAPRMPQKPPRRTRERILETSLALFNRDGEPHVTTADIADEMNISPGNLYYHFRNKDDIIGELYAALEAALDAAARVPAERRADVEDLWLLLHLLFERMRDYRFLYRDLDEITSRNRSSRCAFGALTRRIERAVRELRRSLVRPARCRRASRAIARSPPTSRWSRRTGCRCSASAACRRATPSAGAAARPRPCRVSDPGAGRAVPGGQRPRARRAARRRLSVERRR